MLTPEKLIELLNEKPDLLAPLIVVAMGVGLVITCLIRGERWPHI